MRIEQKVEELIMKLQAGELDTQSREELDKILIQYPEYKDIVDIHNQLSNSETIIPEPEPEQFTQMRAAVMRKIRRTSERAPGRIEQFIQKIQAHALRPEMAVAALTLIIGFLFGRALPPDENSLTNSIMSQINALAKVNTGLEDVKKSPYAYSNVAFKEIDENNIALSFDVTTHLSMISKKDDPMVRDVIAQSLVNPTNLGTELKAISYSEGVFDQKIKEALIYSMNKTPILAVRLKAMNNLFNYKNDPEVEEAFIRVLKEEESVKMRLMAIEYLTESQLKADTLQKIVSESEAPQNPALLIKVKDYRNENK
jgi:hypothetical protein